MESRPKNPEFRNNPENFHPCFQTNESLQKATYYKVKGGPMCILRKFCQRVSKYVNVFFLFFFLFFFCFFSLVDEG